MNAIIYNRSLNNLLVLYLIVTAIVLLERSGKRYVETSQVMYLNSRKSHRIQTWPIPYSIRLMQRARILAFLQVDQTINAFDDGSKVVSPAL
jgi:hypothetical protein